MDARGKGLERVAFDLHVHTPASHDWEDAPCTAAELVAHAIQRGLHGIAVTDHNTSGWIDDVRDAARGTDLTIFPGVELNSLAGNEGIHLICLFDTDARATDIDNFLAVVGAIRGVGDRKEQGTATRGPLEVLEEVERFGGIAVLAHCQSKKGALGSMKGDLRTKLVQHPAVLAVEAPAENYYDEEKRSTRRRVFDILDGTDPVYRRKLAVYQASDNPSKKGTGHSLEAIGSRFTYFYAERPITLESLRQCFVDRESRIDIPPVGTIISAASDAPTVGIRHLRVSSGFLDGLELDFHDGLTTVLGAKGSGKSVIVELLRFALDQEPTQPEIRADHDTKLAKQLGAYGRVSVTVKLAEGDEQVIEREYDPTAHNPFHGTRLVPSDLVRCHFLSQGEIVRIAESEDEQIRFIDSFFDFRAHQRGLNEIRSQLSAIDRDVARQIRARKAARALAAEHEQLARDISAKDTELASPVFARFQAAQAKSQAAKRAVGTISALERSLEEAQSLVTSVPDAPDVPPDLTADPLIVQLTDLASRAQTDAKQRITEAAEAMRSFAVEGQAALQAWEPDAARLAEEYSREARQAGGDMAALSQARARLVVQQQEIETKLHAANQTAAQLKPTVDARAQLLQALDDRQAAYTSDRQNRCDWFESKSGGQIQASVEAGSNRELFHTRLRALKRGSHRRDSEIRAIVDSCTPREFVAALLRFDLSRDSRHLVDIANASGLGLERILVLAEFLLSDDGSTTYEGLLELQYAATPEDRPTIAFRREDGSYAPLADLSTGQKCTALLVMALCEGDSPIIVDQPEDSLDIRSIWTDMCERLRVSKRSRQFIFTTHNSSLAVASDSDMFVVMAADARRGEAVLSGAIDTESVRHEVISLLEGGDTTYFLKQRKYDLRDPYAARSSRNGS